jgi:hypothetical protein
VHTKNGSEQITQARETKRLTLTDSQTEQQTDSVGHRICHQAAQDITQHAYKARKTKHVWTHRLKAGRIAQNTI